MKICVKLICLQIFIATVLMRRKSRVVKYQVIVIIIGKDEISPSHAQTRVSVSSVQIQIKFITVNQHENQHRKIIIRENCLL